MFVISLIKGKVLRFKCDHRECAADSRMMCKAVQTTTLEVVMQDVSLVNKSSNKLRNNTHLD